MPESRAARPWPTLFVTSVALFMVMLDMTIVNVALPSIQRELGAAISDLEWVVNGFTLALASLILVGAKLGDRFGRRTFFLVGVVVFTLGSVACALSTSPTQLIASRVVQGIGGALMGPLSLSLIVAACPPRYLPTAIGIWAGVAAFGSAIGPLVGGYLVSWSTWAAVFWVNVPVGAALFVLTLLIVRESRDPTARAFDLSGTVLVTAGLCALVWALVETTSHNWSDPEVEAGLAVGLALIALFVVRELRTAEPMLPLPFFRVAAFTASNLVVAGVAFALTGAFYFMTLFFQNVQTYSAIDAGIRTLPATVMIVVVAPLAGRLDARVGPRVVVAVGCAAAGSALLGLTGLRPTSEYGAMWPWLMLFGAGLGLTLPATAALAMSVGGHAKAGISSGVLNTFRQVGGAFGLAILGSVASTITRGQWNDFAATLGPALQASAVRLTPLVVGGQGELISRYAMASGASPLVAAGARSQALLVFTNGASAALVAAAVSLFLAAAVAMVGLPRARVEHDEGAELAAA